MALGTLGLVDAPRHSRRRSSWLTRQEPLTWKPRPVANKARPKPLHRIKRWIYRRDRPSAVARVLNHFWARQYAEGRLARARDVALVVRGRSTGKMIVFPVVLADYRESWYLVSMLGEHANWVRNVRAAEGRAVIRHGAAYEVELLEVPVRERAPILRRYVEVAPGARPHVPVDRAAPVEEFDRIAPHFPVFKVVGFGDARART